MTARTITSRKSALQAITRKTGKGASHKLHDGTTVGSVVDALHNAGGSWADVITDTITYIEGNNSKPGTVGERAAEMQADADPQDDPAKEAHDAATEPAGNAPAEAPEPGDIELSVEYAGSGSVKAGKLNADRSAYYAQATARANTAAGTKAGEVLWNGKDRSREKTAQHDADAWIATYTAADVHARRKMIGWKPLAAATPAEAKLAKAAKAPRQVSAKKVSTDQGMISIDRRDLKKSERPTILGVCVAHFFRRLGKLGATFTEARAVVESPAIVKHITNKPEHTGPFSADMIVSLTTLRSEVERSKAGAPTYQAVGEMTADNYALLRSTLADVRAAAK